MCDLAWDEISHDFVSDGSLIDLVVLGTDIPDWQRTIDLVREQDWSSQFEDDGEVRPLPKSVEAIFARHQDHAELLRLRPGRLNANCHFFDTDEIEFDLDPQEFRDQSDVDVLCSFMRTAGRRLGKAVVVTPENTRDVILSGTTTNGIGSRTVVADAPLYRGSPPTAPTADVLGQAPVLLPVDVVSLPT